MASSATIAPGDEPPLLRVYTPDEMPDARREALEALVGGDSRVVAVADSDLLPHGQYGHSHLVLCEDEILVLAEGEVDLRLSLDDALTVQAMDFVGNGELQVWMKDGRRLGVIRYSMSLADVFEQVARRANALLNVSEEDLQEHEEAVSKISGPKEEKETYRCPNCGHPLLQPTDACPKCTSKREVMGRLLQFLFAHRLAFWTGSSLSIIVIAINLAPAVLVRLLIDDVLLRPDLADADRVGRLYLLVALFFGLISIRVVIQYMRIRIMGTLAAKVIFDLRRRIYRSLQRLSLSYYDREHTGRIMARVLNDARGIQQFLVSGVQRIIIDGLMVIAIPIILFVENPLLAGVALIPIPAVALIAKHFSKRFRRIFRTLRRRYANLSAQISETISGIRVVKSFAQEEREVVGFDQKSREVYDAHVATTQTKALFDPGVMFMMTLGTIIVWLIGGRRVIGNTLKLGVLVQFISYMNQFYNPVQRLLELTESVQDCATAAERVFSILDMPSEVADHDNAVRLKDVKGRVVFEGVRFRYGDGGDALRDIDLVVEPGRMIGLVGQTGSGKSTLVSLVCRFYDPTKGRITLDGVGLRDIEVRSLRENIGIVLQETFLFAGSIRENISYGKPDATDWEIIRSAKAANAHDFIMGLPDGYDTEVGERGVGLSGGEKQRIAIARAILKDPAILILDEATSAVDTATEQAIQEAMDRLVKGRTTFAIAHRLSTLRHADQLLVMAGGGVIEKGSHDELMAADGEYAKLVKIQMEFTKQLA